MARTSYPKQLNNIKNTMNPKELKQGQSYLILANFDEKDLDDDYVFIAEPTKRALFLNANAVQACVSLPSDPPTSFGPYRRFRKGDRVRVVAWQGRSPGCSALLGKITTVLRDEYEFGVRIQIGEGESYCTPEACFLELITPVEELEPYEVTESTDYFAVENSAAGDEVATFWKDLHPSPKEAAEIERDRLNAEHRKEQK